MAIPITGSAAAAQGINFDLIRGAGKANGTTGTESTDGSFGSFFEAFMDMYRGTDASIREAQELQTDIALGKSDDIVGLTLSMERADSYLNFTVQVTNRIIEAYKEIMRMQI